MNFQSHFLVIYLLLLFFSPRGVTVEKNVVWGILTKSISLDIPDFLKDQDKDDIRWFKGPTLIAKVNQNGGNHSFYLRDTIYEIFPNGTLKIKELEKNSEQNYKVSVYHKNGTNLLEKVLTLHVMEAVSKPEMTWNCTERIVICEVQRGTDAELTLFENGTQPLKMGTVKKEGMRLKYTWPKKYPPRKEFKCVAKNPVSEEWIVGQTPCTVKVWNIYHILSICGGVIILLIFLTLAISCFLRRKKQKKKPNVTDQNLEIKISRVKEERGRKLHQSPGHHPQLAGGRHPQQPGGHRPQAPGQHLQVPGRCPPVPGHRPQQQQKRPSPKVQKQTGPPLPRPRNQQKPPHQEKEK
ncbi:T-cell surface antigen CD2 isoform X1 [Phascolarctos cinereus]|uniref:T-cell surface antigen CD2 isoform X1 n=1 Tax=Phascolarctos cinereus TaxID=38626 RepID=A0A6P5LLA9_PHACI|nr:T-cell surface antigen CD2 isoform X1 [Phascolarctos cinereus]